MLARIAIIVGVFVCIPLAHGQMMMGNSCPYPFQMAPNAYNPMDGRTLYQRRMDNAKIQLERIDKQIKPLAKRVQDEELAIRHRINGDAAEAIIDHIEGNNEPSVVCHFQAPQYQPYPQPQYQQPQPAPAQPEGRTPGSWSPPPEGHSGNQQLSMDRMPAALSPAGKKPANADADEAEVETPATQEAVAPATPTDADIDRVSEAAKKVAAAQAKAKAASVALKKAIADSNAAPKDTSLQQAKDDASEAKEAADNDLKTALDDQTKANKALKETVSAAKKSAAQAKTETKTRPSDAAVAHPTARQDQEGYGGFGGNGESLFCREHWRVDGLNHNFWEEWTRSDGEVSAEACNITVTGIHVNGTAGSGSIKSKCVTAMHNLRHDYAKLRELKQKYDKVEADYNEFQDHLDEQTEAVPNQIGYNGNNMAGMNFMAQLAGFRNNMMMMSHPMVAPMPTGPMGMGPMGGWPMPPGNMYAPYNYQSYNPGLMGINNGCYGCVTGGVGQGAYGCNGMNNPMLYNNPMMNFGGPGGFRSPYPSWAAGAPFSLPMPHPSVLPMPGGGRGFPPTSPIPYMGAGGMPLGLGGAYPYGGAGYGAGYGAGGYGYGGGGYGGAPGILPAYNGYTGGYSYGSAYGGGNGWATGSIRPMVAGGSTLGYGGIVGSGYYGGGYMPGTNVPPILQPTTILGAGSTVGGRPPSQLPVVP